MREKFEKDNGYEPWRYSEQEYVDYLEEQITKLRTRKKIDPAWNFDKIYVDTHDGNQFCFYLYWDENGELMHYEEY